MLAGIGSHVNIEQGAAKPGTIVVGTDSHLNILGCVGCFGQGMGDKDIAYIFATGRNWFEVPQSMRIVLEGYVAYPVTAKDVTLEVLRRLGSAGALGKVIEFAGPGAESLSFSGKITLASMATEMGAVAAFLPVDRRAVRYLRARSGDASRMSKTRAAAARAASGRPADACASRARSGSPKSGSVAGARRGRAR